MNRKINVDTALDLGQLFPPFFTARCEDFSSSRRLLSGKIAVLVTTFSLGRLVCSFHEAGIIVKFVWNIQPFVWLLFLVGQKRLCAFFRSCLKNIFVSSWTNTFFAVESFSHPHLFVSFWGTNIYFGLFLLVDNVFISYLCFCVIFFVLEYVLINNQYYPINNLWITMESFFFL